MRVLILKGVNTPSVGAGLFVIGEHSVPQSCDTKKFLPILGTGNVVDGPGVIVLLAGEASQSEKPPRTRWGWWPFAGQHWFLNDSWEEPPSPLPYGVTSATESQDSHVRHELG
jgi:hypothetical protein